jgi:hypothetical protein
MELVLGPDRDQDRDQDEARVLDLDQVLDPGGSSSSSRHRVLDQERDEAGPVG